MYNKTIDKSKLIQDENNNKKQTVFCDPLFLF